MRAFLCFSERSRVVPRCPRGAVALLAAALSAGAALTLGSPDASAQDETYRRLAEDAARAVTARRFDDALTLFREMHALAPSARTLWSLGRVHYELGEYATALGFLEQALEDPRRALEGELRAEAVALRDRASALIAEYEVVVTPEGATVLADDLEARGRRLRLDPGEHVLRFELAGHRSVVRRVVVRGGERETLRIQLSPGSDGVVGVLGRAPSVDLGVAIGVPTATGGPVEVEVRSVRPGLRLYLQPLATSGSPGPTGPMDPICVAPCDSTLRSGMYAAAVGHEEGDPAPVLAGLRIDAPAVLHLDLEDNHAVRVGGLVAAASLLVTSAASLVLGGLMIDSGNRDLHDSGWGVAFLTTGTVLGVFGLAALGTVTVDDRGVVRVTPR